MWLAITLPAMILGVGIAVIPVLWWSMREHRRGAYHRSAERCEVDLLSAKLASVERLVRCPLCTVSLRGAGDSQLVDEVRRHAWRTHGIPSDTHILESALQA